MPETEGDDLGSMTRGVAPSRRWSSSARPANRCSPSRATAPPSSKQGRPACQFCGNPIDAEGHACPAMNGHSKRH